MGPRSHRARCAQHPMAQNAVLDFEIRADDPAVLDQLIDTAIHH
jgi:hypothetical protein